jgi:HEAT repeat protein
MSDSLPWIADLLSDSRPRVWDAAVRALGDLGGSRAVDALMSATGRIPQHRLAIELAHAASDMDIEALMREPASVQAAVVTVLACGLRRDPLRAGPLSGIAHDRRWPARVRVAACRSLAMIGDPGYVDGLRSLAGDPDVNVRSAALKAQRRLESAGKAGPG